MTDVPVDLGIAGLADLRRIGSGGNAVVYSARQPALDRTVVVKVLIGFETEATRRRFDRERRAMGRLSSVQGIAPVYDTGFTTSGQPYLIMPWYAGGSLQDHLDARGPLESSQVRDLGIAICTAVEAAHRNGVLHRDIKPANILVDRHTRPWVADFGIAHLFDDGAETSQALTMTPLYTAPEVFDGAHPAVAGDVYSIGATLFALLNGRAAHADTDGAVGVLALMRRINEEPLPELAGSVPPGLQRVVHAAMNHDPAQRPASAGELAHLLANVDMSPARRRGWFAAHSRHLAVAAVIVAAVVAAAVALMSGLGRGAGTTDATEPASTVVSAPTVGAGDDQIDRFAVAARQAALSAVTVEGFSCVGVNVAPGMVLPNGLVLTADYVINAPWLVQVVRSGESVPAEPMSTHPERALGMAQLAAAPAGIDVARAMSGMSVVVVDRSGDAVAAQLFDDGLDGFEVELGDDSSVERGALIMTEAGELVAMVSRAGSSSVPVVAAVGIEAGWSAEPPRQTCDDLDRSLTSAMVTQAASPAIAELLLLQQLSDAFAQEQWSTVRALEPAKATLTDAAFVDGWGPLAQSFLVPVRRVAEGDGPAEWRLGLIGHERWNGDDITTVFCVTWIADVSAMTVVQTNEDTLRIFGSQPGEAKRAGFVDPSDVLDTVNATC